MPYYANATPPRMFLINIPYPFHSSMSTGTQTQSHSVAPPIPFILTTFAYCSKHIVSSHARTHAVQFCAVIQKVIPMFKPLFPKPQVKCTLAQKTPHKNPPKAEKFRDPTDPAPFASPCLSFLHSCTAQAKESKEGQKEEVLLNQCCVRPPLLGIVCMYS